MLSDDEAPQGQVSGMVVVVRLSSVRGGGDLRRNFRPCDARLLRVDSVVFAAARSDPV